MNESNTKLGQYLRLIGRLYPDNTLRLRPGYLTSNPQPLPSPANTDFIARLFDGKGELLLRHPILARPYDPSVQEVLAVRCNIPFPPATSTIHFFRGEVLIHKINVSRGKPTIKLRWAPGPRVEGKQTVSWTAKHPERLPLQYFVLYTHSGDRRWQGIATRLKKSEFVVNFDELPGGERCRIAVFATDGVNTTRVESKVFSLPVKPCRTFILAPTDGAVLVAGAPCVFRGQGFLLEEFRPEIESLKWRSSIDGDLGTGRVVRVDKLSVGKHKITLMAGANDRIGSSNISIIVRSELPKPPSEPTRSPSVQRQ